MKTSYWTWRRRAKLSALLLPFGLATISHQFFAVLASVLLIVALLVDVVRLSVPKINQGYLAVSSFTKPKETRRLSGYTFFLASTAILFWFFPTTIAVVALSFFIVSDLIAPIIGQRWLTREIAYQKTWGGAIGIVIACLVTGFLITQLYPLAIDPKMLVVGAVSVAILDQLSFLLDDNLLVPLGTAVLLLTIF